MALLDEGGLDAVTVTAVAHRARVSRPAVYRRYPDANELGIAVLMDEGDRLLRDAKEQLDPALNPLDLLLGLSERYFAWHTARPQVARALYREAMFSEPAWATRFQLQGIEMVGWVAERLAYAQARGELSANADPFEVAQAWFAMFITTAVAGMQGLFPTLRDRVEALRPMVELVLRGAQHPD